MEVILSLACANTALVAGCVRNLVINLIPYDVPPRPTFDENGRWVAVGSVDKLQDNIVQTLGKVEPFCFDRACDEYKMKFWLQNDFVFA